MPDVGVLNLQIQDNSEKAASGLDSLATALERVKQAVGSGLQLGNIAGPIKKVTEALQTAIPEQSIARLERLASAIEKINQAGGVRLSGLKSLEKLDTENIGQSIQQGIERGVSDGFETVGRRIQETREDIDGMRSGMEQFNGLVQQTAWSAGDMAEQFKRAFKAWNSIRASMSLSGGQQPLLGDGSGKDSTAWTYYNPYGETTETGWTEWKNGAIEVEYTISDAMSSVSDSVDNASNRISLGAEQLRLMGETAPEVERVSDSVNDVGEQTRHMSEEAVSFMRVWDEATRSFVNIPLTQAEYNDALDRGAARWEEIREAAEATRAEVASAETPTDSLSQRMGELFSSARSIVSTSFSNLKSGISSLISPVTSLTNQLWRVAKYRMLRSAIKQVTSAFSEGIENYYNYSAAIKNGFSASMDSAATSLQTFKNSIGAAVAPLIQELIPYLQIVVNWFVSLINYANQFIALMRGQSTWSRATNASAKAFDKTKKSATGAAAAIKDLLADWDELNIIQSETSGAGSGGGGSSNLNDAVKMFEESTIFNKTIKSAVEYIKEHFDDIKEIATAIGTAILAWKISSAFEGFIGQLLQLVAGGVMIAVGLKLGYNGGFDLGTDGFSMESLLKMVTGDLIAAAGGWLIMGKEGLVIALGASLMFNLIGYIEGLQDSADKLKWGEDSLTPEQVKEWVEGQFSFEINPRIMLMKSIVTKDKEAESEFNEHVKALRDALTKVRVGVDNSEPAITEAATAAQQVIADINARIKQTESNIEILTKITPITSENGEEDLTGEYLSDLKGADKTLTDYFTNLGKDIANWIDKGQKSEWKNNEAEMALELMKHEQAIFDKAEENKIARNFQVESEVNLAGMTRDNAEQALKEQQQLINDYMTSTEEAYKSQVKDLFYYADLADAAGLKDEEGNPLSDMYIGMANALLKQIEDGTIYKDIMPDIEKMRQGWIDTLKKIYGGDIDASSIVNVTDIFSQALGKGTYFEEAVRSALKSGDEKAAAKVIEDKLSAALDAIDPNGIIESAMSTFGFSIFDILKIEDQKTVIDAVYRAVNGDSNTAYAILNAMGISNETIANALKSSIEGGLEEASIGEQILGEMENQDWQHMSAEAFKNLQLALAEKFGNEAVLDALGDLDIPTSDIVLPMDVTVQESVDEVTAEPAETADETAWNNLGYLYNNGEPYQLPDLEAKAGLDLTVDEDQVTIAGIPVEGGWLNNLIGNIFGIGNGTSTTPIEQDVNVHINVDEDDEDISILDLLEDPNGRSMNRKLIKTSDIVGFAGASTENRYRGSNVNGNQAPVEVAINGAEQQANVRSGVVAGTNELLRVLQAIRDTANAISRKDFTVVINPSAAWGDTNEKSAKKRAAVTGDVP